MGVLRLSGHISMTELVTQLSTELEKLTGNKLGAKQAPMVESRLRRRMQELKLTTPQEYASHLQGHFSHEIGELVGLLTTHHTFFFREWAHFEWLQEQLPELIKRARGRADKTIRIWSAACSRGQEVWSLAAFLDQLLKSQAPDVRWHILGTDIDPQSVQFARNAVYLWEEVKKIPVQFMGGNFIRGKGDIQAYAKVANTLRAACEFKVMNLLSLEGSGIAPASFDVIFCRNVFIYFDQPTIQAITLNFQRYVHPQGFLVLGLSESLQGTQTDMRLIGPSVYALRSQKSEFVEKLERDWAHRTAGAGAQRRRLRVLCVDDSPSILSMLKKALVEEHDFEVVGTAKNGVEAHEMQQRLRPDVMTLDIHMPEMTGIDYLRKYFNPAHPPVVIVSSASREDLATTTACFGAGAADFVEKPTLQDFPKTSEEIRAKLRSAFRARGETFDLAHLSEFSRTLAIHEPQSKELWFVVTPASRAWVWELLKELPANHPKLRLWVAGRPEVVTPLLNSVVPADFRRSISVESFERVATHFFEGRHVLAFASADVPWGELPTMPSGVKLVVEEGGALPRVSFDVSPRTSFPYLMLKYFLDDK